MKPIRCWVGMAGLLLVFRPQFLAPQEPYVPTRENLAARASFREAKFGLFIHFGLYSVLGKDAWVLQTRKVPLAKYEWLANLFEPSRFHAAEIVALAKATGMQYIAVTTKHHDGFAMFDSKVSDWSIVRRTPYGKDIVGELAAECRRQGMKLFLYYSQMDWHHPNYTNRGLAGTVVGRPRDTGAFAEYVDFMDAQLTELLTNYGPIAGVWFDGMWDNGQVDWRLDRTYAMIHRLQPATLIGSNHGEPALPGEDFQTFEARSTNPDEWRPTLPVESSEMINTSWGFNIGDSDHKSSADLIRQLVRTAGRDANFLLNIGPMPTGEVQPEFLRRLHDIGVWFAVYGIAVRGTRGGPFSPRPWGVTTQAGNRIFVHVLDWSDRVLALPPVPKLVKSARLLKDQSVVRFHQTESGVVLDLPHREAEEIDQVIILETEG